MLRRRLPTLIVVAAGLVLGIAIAGVPSTAQTPALTTVSAQATGGGAADPGITGGSGATATSVTTAP